jgi:hypothetical protein
VVVGVALRELVRAKQIKPPINSWDRN